MDLVAIIDTSIEGLPTGEHTQGLVAIRRHIASAIRHFEREDGGRIDSHTDAIYRCNQAFEGGLKEAYRVLAEKDPQRHSPYEIEKYLEENNVVRHRVLKQLTRYREDYRNPSTHDYRIDFDEDESLLAIVSVCAFTKLLINQISGKLAFNAGKSLAASSELDKIDSVNLRQSLSKILINLLQKLPEKNIPEDSETIAQFINGALLSYNFETEFRADYKYGNGDEDIPWSNVVSVGEAEVPIEVRLTPNCDLERSIDWITEKMREEGKVDAILIVANTGPLLNFSSRTINTDIGGKIELIFPDKPPNFSQSTCQALYGKLTA